MMAYKKSSGLKLVFQRDFGSLFWGQVTSRIGNGVNWIAVMWIVYEATGSPLKMSIVGICQVVPLLILGPFLGAYIDRADRKTVIIVSDVACAFCVALIPLLDLSGALELWHIYFLVVAKALFSELFSIGINSGMPLIVNDEELPAVNSLLAATVQTGELVGPALAAILMSVFDVRQVLYFDAATFFISACCIWRMRIPGKSKIPESAGKLWTEAWKGLVFISGKNRLLLQVVILVAGVNLCVPSLMVLIPIFSSKILAAGKEGFAVIFSGWGAGMIIAFLLVASRKHPVMEYKWITRAYVLAGFSVATLGLCGNLYFSIIFFMIVGFCIGTAGVLISTFIQREAPSDMRGRVFAVYGMCTHATIPVSMLLAGWFSSRFNPDALIVFVGVVLLSIALAASVFINRQFVWDKQQAEESL